jgi:TetR/AcrR family transcriptional repressor of nem operon
MAETEKGLDTKSRIMETAKKLVLEKGFAATSLDEILRGTGVTKGAFFHHFRSKAELGRKLVERFADDDFELFDSFTSQSAALADDPLQEVFIFLKLFEEWLDDLPEPFAGCMFAVYVYENRQFEPDVNDFVAKAFRRWAAYYQDKFAAVLAARRPAVEIGAEELAEMMVSLLEGAFILSRAYDDPGLISRQSRMFRSFLRLLFAEEPAAASA